MKTHTARTIELLESRWVRTQGGARVLAYRIEAPYNAPRTRLGTE